MAEQDLQLLEKVLMRFALSDTQIEKCLDSFLAASLLKMGSPHEATQKKVCNCVDSILGVVQCWHLPATRC